MAYRQKKSHYDYHPLPREEGEPEALESVKLLPPASRERLMKLFDDGTLKPTDLDHKSIVTLQQLSEPFQLKVLEYLQVERLFLANSRSKAGFLVSACDRAKKGELDARGFGALDPWRGTLLAECKPRLFVELIPESDWVANLPGETIALKIVDSDNQEYQLTLPATSSISAVKDSFFSTPRKSADSYPRSRLRLSHPVYGSLRDERSLAYYNLNSGDSLQVKLKVRGGRKVSRQIQ